MARREDIEQKIVKRRLRPVRADGLFILEDEQNVETMSPGGIVIPARPVEGKTRKATVVAVGKGVDELKIGDRVLFDRAYGNRIPHEDEQSCRLLYLTLNQLEAVIDDEEKVG